VVLDEPASGLDPGMRERAFRAAADQADGDTAVVVSSHALDLVDDHADRVVVLRRGEVAAEGPSTGCSTSTASPTRVSCTAS